MRRTESLTEDVTNYFRRCTRKVRQQAGSPLKTQHSTHFFSSLNALNAIFLIRVTFSLYCPLETELWLIS